MFNKPYNHKIFAKLTWLLMSMHRRIAITCTHYTGNGIGFRYTGIVNRVSAEDGSGTRFLVEFSEKTDPTPLYLDLVRDQVGEMETSMGNLLKYPQN